MLTRDERKVLRELAEKSTRVNAWHPYRGGDGYGPEASVRGPCFRWLKCTKVEQRYADMVADEYDEVKFAAAAMNNLVPALDSLDEKDARISDLESKLRDAVEALEFYGRLGVPRGCTPVGDWSPDFLVRDPYWQDQGKTARAALAGIKGGKK